MNALIFWLVALGITCVSAFPAWIRMLKSGYYWHLPFAAIALLLLILIRFRDCKLPSGVMKWLLVVLGVGMQIASHLQQSPWLAAFGFVLIVIAFLNCCQARDDLPKSIRSLAPLKVPLTSLVPLVIMLVQVPKDYDITLSAKVYECVGQLASYCLDLLSIPNSIGPLEIKLPGAEFTTKELQFVTLSPLMMAFALIMVQVVRNRSPWLAPCYFLAGIIVCLLMNCCVYLVVLVAKLNYGVDLLVGWPALLVYCAIVLGGLLMALSMDRFLNVTFAETRPDEINEWNNPINSLWNRIFSIDGAN